MAPRSPTRRRSSLGWALLVSLLVHGLVLIAFSVAPKTKPATKKSEAAPIDLVYLPVEVKQPAAQQQAVTPPAKKVKKSAVTKAQPQVAQQQQAPVEQLGNDTPAAESQPQSEEPPTKLSLVPEWTLPLTGKSGASPHSRSHTLRNDGFGPTEEEVKQYQAEVTQRRLNNELRGEGSRAAILSGNVPRELGALEGQLVDAVAGDRAFLTPQQKANPTKQGILDGLNAYQGAMEQYGKTGSPLANTGDSRAVEESGFGRTFLSNPNAPQFGDAQGQQMMYGALQSMAAVSAINKRRYPRLETWVELEQTATGKVFNARLIKTSGNKDFDLFALQTTLDVAGRMSFDGGTRPAWRSVWEFVFEHPKVSVDLREAVPAE